MDAGSIQIDDHFGRLNTMGIMIEILVLLLSGIGIFIAGVIRKSKTMKIASLAVVGLSLGMFFAVWMSLAYM